MPTICKNTEAGSVCYSKTESGFTHSIIYVEGKTMKLHNVQMWTGTKAESTDYEIRSSLAPNSNTALK